jgi:Transglycosylase associated protein
LLLSLSAAAGDCLIRFNDLTFQRITRRQPVLGIIGGILGGAITHLFAPPTSERFHPAGLILSTLGAIVVLYVCIKLGIRFPRIG